MRSPTPAAARIRPCCSPAARCSSARSAGPTCSARSTRVPYARAMYRSLHEVVLAHDDHVAVHPTHGAGSLCATDIASTPTSTIGYERRHNQLLHAADVEAFVRRLLRGQPAVPRYFARMRPTNQAGPALLGGRVPEPRPLDLEETRRAIAAGALLLDLRPPGRARGRRTRPGSQSIPLGPSFGTWLGWVVDPDRPLVLILERPADWDEAIRQALRIGAEGSILGHLRGGFGTWADGGGPLESSGRLNVDQLAERLDRGGAGGARSSSTSARRTSTRSGHVPGSVHITAGSLPDRLAELPVDRPIATICASGLRASVAASILRTGGFRGRLVGRERRPGLEGRRAPGRPRRGARSEAAGARPRGRASGSRRDLTGPHPRRQGSGRARYVRPAARGTSGPLGPTPARADRCGHERASAQQTLAPASRRGPAGGRGRRRMRPGPPSTGRPPPISSAASSRSSRPPRPA